MQIVLSPEDLDALPPQSRADVLSLLSRSAEATDVTIRQKTTRPALPALSPPSEIDPVLAAEFDWENVADLMLKDVQKWMQVAQERTKLGLRVFAEHGPVIDAKRLVDAGIDNLSHFQSRTTMRTRTVTGDRDAFLMAWDHWAHDDDGKLISGRYAITPITHQSLRRYFKLDQ